MRPSSNCNGRFIYWRPEMATFARNNQIVLLARDRSTVEPLRQNLRLHGFAAISISEPAAAVDALCMPPPDLVLLDWTLPAGVRESVREQKQKHGFSLIVLAPADCSANDVSIADAHVFWPLDVGYIIGRVQALLRHDGRAQGPMLVCDDLVLDQGSREVAVRGVPLPMSEGQFRLLECFMQRQGKLCPRSLLLQQVWNSGKQPAARTVDVNVQRLRQWLEAAGCRHSIVTVRGGGYQFMPSGPGGSRQGD